MGLLLVGVRVPAVLAGSHASHALNEAKVSDPNAACAGCHREIYERYRKTPMANASGPATEGFLPANFTHKPSGIAYRIDEEAGHVHLKFEREPEIGQSPQPGTLDRSLKGERELRYFLGSGRRGRTFLFEQEGYWFEIPINWYAKKHLWDMAPGYLETREMPLTLPVDPGCLRCHASEAQPNLPEARNHYAGEPFLAGGITCTSCHGDAAAHLASGGHKPLMKLDQLEPVRRDSICLSCHLEGEETVVHEGKRLVDFRPGDNIFDYASYFVRRSSTAPGQAQTRATSQWEALLQSGCKRASGDKLTCTSCHDPHSSAAELSPTQRAAFYRARCLTCHDPAGNPNPVSTDRAAQTAGSFAATHHPDKPDCLGCHMPAVASSDIAHEQVTDHGIPRIPEHLKPSVSSHKPPLLGAHDLIEIGPWTGTGADGKELGELFPSDRDLGIAFALAAEKCDKAAALHAMQLLRQASTQVSAKTDDELHAQLAFFEQVLGDKQIARTEYVAALSANPDNSFAAGNLALLKIEDRRYSEAVTLWSRAFQDDPAELRAGMNLAIVECGLGHREAALASLSRILDFSPDYGPARQLLQNLRSGNHTCGSKP